MASQTVRSSTRSNHLHTIRVPRTKGAVTGILLILLGIWGALIPFVGPAFGYEYESGSAWVWTSARFWLEVLPGAVSLLGGLLLLLSTNRIVASLGGWLAAASGAWFIVGQTSAPILGIGSPGSPTAASDAGRAAEALGFFEGLGAVVLFLAAFALGRLAVVGVRDVRAARRHDEQVAIAEEAARVAAARADAAATRPPGASVPARSSTPPGASVPARSSTPLGASVPARSGTAPRTSAPAESAVDSGTAGTVRRAP
jgi:hypothetical protein